MHSTSSGGTVTLEPRPRLARNPVVVCHGGNGSALDLSVLAVPEQPPRRLVDHGFSVIATTLDVECWWGAPEGVAATKASIAQHRATLDGVGPVVLYGGSMGATTALQTALTMPDEVACIVLVLPCLDLEYQRRTSEELRAYINEAWDMTPIRTNLAPLPNGANPIDRADELSAIPIRLMYATDDEISHGAETFAAQHGNTTLVSLGALGHTAAALAKIDPDAVAAFVQAHTGSGGSAR